MTLKLRFLAGPTALAKITQQGLDADLFTQVLAASGGPKWLGIAGLDKYLFGEFFKHRSAPLYTLGASSGAWRLACFAQQDPLAAYARLEQLYIGQIYEVKPTPIEVSQQVKQIVSGILGEQTGRDIIDNPVINSHFVTCRGKHLNRLASRTALGAGLATTAISNLVSRKTLGLHFQRVTFGVNDFTQRQTSSPFAGLNDLPSIDATLTQDNLSQVMLATGSIPWVLAPVSNIVGAPAGAYYDGGITDYHFDLPLSHATGLTLYPHFYPHMLPGWFDKSLPWRRAKANYHNGLILAPTEDYLRQLPYGKLPDRKDFIELDTQSRITYWQRAVEQSQILAEEFDKVLKSGDILKYIEPL
ncbi:alpha/beta hydrolase [Shewanella sp. Isolate11]|uniref:alpha/beta hydrolase n=1 Tax=Shewanella sp. Isolate11 TaxID=2908530 RepID=UPI001EFD7380|nr:alpha/beta hydrolase [Shewanella sp. Isolate11]MCG9698211.1 alpha/beta hydrolase [Shewanella sp. Isolate11]